MPWPLVNRFTVLKVETNIDDGEPIDIPPPSTPKCNLFLQRPKWEKKLPIWLSTSVLDVHGTSLQLAIELSTMDTSKLHSVKTLLDSRAMESFIDQDFIYSKGLNTWTILCPILVFNIDSFPNEAGKISEVVDILLRYSPYLERMLLAILGLRKQDLILEYNWLKSHNPKIDWRTSKVEMMYCPLCCKEGYAIYKK